MIFADKIINMADIKVIRRLQFEISSAIRFFLDLHIALLLERRNQPCMMSLRCKTRNVSKLMRLHYMYTKLTNK